jgi:hypothetical protein
VGALPFQHRDEFSQFWECEDLKRPLKCPSFFSHWEKSGGLTLIS